MILTWNHLNNVPQWDKKESKLESGIQSTICASLPLNSFIFMIVQWTNLVKVMVGKEGTRPWQFYSSRISNEGKYPYPWLLQDNWNLEDLISIPVSSIYLFYSHITYSNNTTFVNGERQLEIPFLSVQAWEVLFSRIHAPTSGA